VKAKKHLATCLLVLVPAFCAQLALGQGWKVGNGDLSGSRSVPSSAQGGLTKSAVRAQGLEIKWFAATDHPVPGVPAVLDGVVYAGSATGDGTGQGSMWAFDAETGAVLWNTGPAEGLTGGVLASPLVVGGTVYVGTLTGTLAALNRHTGEILWSYKPNVGGFFDSIWSGPIKIRNMIVFAINPQDEAASFDPPGVAAVIAVDARTGAQTPADEIWRFTPVPAAQQGDVGGAGIWGTSPAYSPELDLVFVSTGQTTFSRDGVSSPGSDSVFAIEASTGELRWQNQVKSGDIWNFTMPFDPTDPHDMDIGEAPAVFKSKGRVLVAVGSKRGYFYIMDAATGVVQNSTGTGTDALGFRTALDVIGGLPGPGLDGGFNLDSGFFEKNGRTTHFGILNDYTTGMTAVANQVFPWDGSFIPAGLCFIQFFGLPAECPPKDSGDLVLINEDGTAELGRYRTGNGKAIFSPVYLDDMIFVRDSTNFLAPDALLVIDVSDPANPTLMETVSLDVLSLGAQVSISGGRIYTGSGFFSSVFGTPSGLFSLGLVGD
jgi:outer membrane protein assembly factor BamB